MLAVFAWQSFEGFVKDSLTKCGGENTLAWKRRKQDFNCKGEGVVLNAPNEINDELFPNVSIFSRHIVSCDSMVVWFGRGRVLFVVVGVSK